MLSVDVRCMFAGSCGHVNHILGHLESFLGQYVFSLTIRSNVTHQASLPQFVLESRHWLDTTYTGECDTTTRGTAK